MSTSRNILSISSNFEKDFLKKFGFYLDSLDEIFVIMDNIGLDETNLSELPKSEGDIYKSILFLMEAANTTSIGALRLLSGNIFSDANGLLRILYEIACIMHWGNASEKNKAKIYNEFFKSEVSTKERSKLEWQLIKSAQKLFEDEKSGMLDIRKELDNYGSHISLKKIVMGNVTNMGRASSSTIFTSNFNNILFLRSLDFLHSLMLLILEEYSFHNKAYGGLSPDAESKIQKLPENFLLNVRPKLISLQI